MQCVTKVMSVIATSKMVSVLELQCCNQVKVSERAKPLWMESDDYHDTHTR